MKKIRLSAALLCAIASACATIALQAVGAQAASASASTSAAPTGATAAPSASASTGRQGMPSPQSGTGPGTALATWFGPGLFGNQTACGQVLTRRLVGLANRKLPCGTLVKVSFHGRALTLPVVDRGPYGPLHASFDLTQAAARMLHMTETSRVAAAIVGHVPSSPRLGLPPTASGAGAGRTAQQASASAGGAAAG